MRGTSQTAGVQRRGRVFIAPVDIPPGHDANDAVALIGIPCSSAFWASWEVEDTAGECAYFRTTQEAIAWGRKRSRVVLIRLGSRRDETYFSAGETRAYDNDGKPMPVWPAEDE